MSLLERVKTKSREAGERIGAKLKASYQEQKKKAAYRKAAGEQIKTKAQAAYYRAEEQAAIRAAQRKAVEKYAPRKASPYANMPLSFGGGGGSFMGGGGIVGMPGGNGGRKKGNGRSGSFLPGVSGGSSFAAMPGMSKGKGGGGDIFSSMFGNPSSSNSGRKRYKKVKRVKHHQKSKSRGKSITIHLG